MVNEDQVRSRLHAAVDGEQPSERLRARTEEAIRRGERRRRAVPALAVAAAMIAAVVAVPMLLQDEREERPQDVRTAHSTTTVAPATTVPKSAVAPEGWTVVPQQGSPSPRYDHAAVWAAGRFVVLGGTDGELWFDDAYSFDPVTSSWKTLPAAPISGRGGAGVVTDGTKVYVWGGYDGSNSGAPLPADGAVLDVATGTWTKLPKAPIAGRNYPAAAWTGSEVLLWGGGDDTGTPRSDGAAYDPASGEWRTLAKSPLVGRRSMSTTWTGDGLFVWGGSAAGAEGTSEDRADGAVYDPDADTWRTLERSPLSARQSGAAVTVGDRVVVWGGLTTDGEAPPAPHGAVYDLSSRRWSSLPAAPVPEPRAGAAAALVGGRFVAWGGFLGYGIEADAASNGAVFDVAERRWAPTKASTLRARATPAFAVGTGPYADALFIWGGVVGDLALGDGAIYRPGAAAAEPAGAATTVPPTTTTPTTKPTPTTEVSTPGNDKACDGDFGVERGEEGVIAFVDAYFAARAAGRGADGCLSAEAKAAYEKGDGGLCLYTCDGRRVTGEARERRDVRQADASSWEVQVTVALGAERRTETLFVGSGTAATGRRGFVVRGAQAGR